MARDDENADVKAPASIDFAFLARQTFDDGDLEREVLQLFVAQARRVVPALRAMTDRDQGEAAHLLSGSARGIGAWEAAAAAAAYEIADAATRAMLLERLAACFEAAGAAIDARLVSLRS